MCSLFKGQIPEVRGSMLAADIMTLGVLAPSFFNGLYLKVPWTFRSNEFLFVVDVKVRRDQSGEPRYYETYHPTPINTKESMTRSASLMSDDHIPGYLTLSVFFIHETSSPQPQRSPKTTQYDTLVTRGWIKTLAIRSYFDFKFSRFRVFDLGSRVLGFRVLGL